MISGRAATEAARRCMEGTGFTVIQSSVNFQNVKTAAGKYLGQPREGSKFGSRQTPERKDKYHADIIKNQPHWSADCLQFRLRSNAVVA